MKKIFKIVPYLIIAVLVGVTVASAGSLTPPGSVANTMYSLTDIYNLSAGTTTTLGSGTIPTTPGSILATGKTLTEIYDAISTEVAKLSSGVIASGTNPFGITGAGIISLGDAVAGNVLAGKYFSNATTANVLGTMTDRAATSYTPSNVAQTIVAGYYNGSGTVATDVNLVTGNIASGVTIFGVAGKTEVVDTTEATVPIATGTVLTGKKGFVNGALITGTMPAGYTYGDSNAALVLGTATGAGTALVNLWNGTSGAFTGGSQANGGADDYNNGGSAASGRYAGGWTQCTSGDTPVSYCQTGDALADAKDNSTGLVWSLPCKNSGCSTMTETSPSTYSWDSSAVNNNSRTASQLCTDHSGWSLPHEKQLMQAYIDGSYGNLVATGSFRDYWSATTVSYDATGAWNANLSHGSTFNPTKTLSYYVRCVR